MVRGRACIGMARGRAWRAGHAAHEQRWAGRGEALVRIQEVWGPRGCVGAEREKCRARGALCMCKSSGWLGAGSGWLPGRPCCVGRGGRLQHGWPWWMKRGEEGA
jgi:hypothetical protein